MSGLFILNVGSGDTKITFDKSKPEEVEKARRVVQDMLKRGYAILVEAGQKDGKPIYYRATAFDAKTDEYIVAGAPEESTPEEVHKELVESTKDIPYKAPRKGKGKKVKAEGTKAVAVARSAGGMSTAADSVEMENMRKLDIFHPLRAALAAVAEKKSEWAGIPMPIENQPLVIEPSYPNAEELMKVTSGEPASKEQLEELASFKRRNVFFSHKLRCDVRIWEKDGKVFHTIEPAIHSLRQQIATVHASEAWGVEQEAAALQLLARLIPHFAFKRYLMTGCIIESSTRSGLTYIFRRLRPTVAVSFKVQNEGKILAALCMHPIAYYEGSWAGAMCPTDDVIAHLMLMRGDEHMFWKRSNQHHPIRPEAGL